MRYRFLLDADTCSDFLRRADARLMSKFSQYGGRFALSAITVSELRVGAEKRGSPQLSAAVEELLQTLPCLAWDEAAAAAHARLRQHLNQAGTLIGVYDTMTAAHALAHDLRLVTNNTAHFERVPDLELDNWLA